MPRKRVILLPPQYLPPPDPLAFPEDIADMGWCGKAAAAYEEIYESPKYAFFMAFLTCLGSVISGNVRVETAIKSDPRFYTVLLGESGNTRKSTAKDVAIDFFQDTLPDFNVAFGGGSGEGIVSALSRSRFTNRLLLAPDEWQQVINKGKLRGSSLIPCINILFESNKYSNPLKSVNNSIQDGHLAILSASTNDTYESCWDADNMNIGLNNRLFIVPIAPVEPGFVLPPKIAPDVYKALQEELLQIVAETSEGMEYPIDEAAERFLQNWYSTRERDGVKSTRIDTYAVRTLTVLAANDHKYSIDFKIVNDATILADWQLKVRKIHTPVVTDNKFSRLQSRILNYMDSYPGRKKYIYQQKCGGSYYGLKMFNDVWDALQKSEYIQKDIEGNWTRVTGRKL